MRPKRRRRVWLVPIGLILLSLVPVIAGTMRLTELTGGADISPDNARFFASPIPVVAHIISVTVYCLLGAFQFVPSLRGRRRWHRMSGLLLIPAGLVSGLTGMWMAAFSTLPSGDNVALMVIRLVVGSAMVASIVLGARSLLRRDYATHGAWMTRAYAIGVAAGTQALVLTLWAVLVGTPDAPMVATLMAAAWLINAVWAELVILRRARVRLGSAASA